MERTLKANLTEESDPQHQRLLACHNSWLEWKIMPSPCSIDSAKPLCPHIFSRGNTIVSAPNDNFYIISPHTCTCGSEKVDLYLFSPADSSFIPIKTSGETMSVPYVYGSGIVGGSEGRIVLVAGSGTDDGVDLHVYSLDLKNKQWTRVAITGSAPAKRTWYTAVTVGSKIFVFGGIHSSDTYNDLWAVELDETTPSWQSIESSTPTRPTARGCHICIHNGTHLIVSGGWTPSKTFNDTWTFDLRTRKWEELHCSGSLPPSHHRYAGIIAGNVIYTFGGVSKSDFWALDLSKRQWHSLSTAGLPKGDRYDHAMIHLKGKIYMFGGHHTTESIDQKNILHSFDINSMPNADLREQSQEKQPKDILPPKYSINAPVPQPDSDGSILSSLLLLLRTRLAGPVSSMVDAASMDLMRKLLRVKNYVSLSLRLDAPSDIESLVEFSLYLLKNNLLLYSDVPDANRRARRLMQNLIVQLPFVPKSLLLSEIQICSDQTVRWEALGDVIKGDIQGKTVVLKLLRTTPSKNFYRELLTWRSIHHENVLSILGIYDEKRRRRMRYLALPAMENGTLSRWRRETKPTVEEVQRVVLQVAEGLRYLHSEGVVHGDIRGSNIYLDSALNAKISNFSMLKASDSMSTQIRSPNFAAPELFSDWDDDSFSDSESDVHVAAWTEKSDVYAFGCLYYEVHFNAIPFNNVAYDQLATLVSKDRKRPDQLDLPTLKGEAWNLMRRCWRTEPRKRPTMDVIVDEMAEWDSDQGI